MAIAQWRTRLRSETGTQVRPDSPAVRAARALAHLLDDSLRVPWTSYRFGLDSVVGLLPVAGDAVSAVASLYIVGISVYAGLPRWTVARMLALVAIDFVFGSIPIVGLIVDVKLKANLRNLETLESHVTAAE